MAYSSIDRFDIPGRGHIRTVETTDELGVGQVIELDGEAMEIRGIELMRTLTDPPRVLQPIGLVVRPI